MFFRKFFLCACVIGAVPSFEQSAYAEMAERMSRVERLPAESLPPSEPSPPLYLMVRNLPVSVHGFGQYSFSTSSKNREGETGFKTLWLMTEVAPGETVEVSIIPDLASRSVVEAVTRVHSPGSWIGFQFGKFRGPFQQMTMRPDMELVAGGARASALTIPFPLGAEVFMRFHSVKLYMSALSDDAKGSLTGQQVTNGNARIAWKVNERLIVEEAFITGHKDGKRVVGAATRVGYAHERLKVEAFSVYHVWGQAFISEWEVSLATAYRLADQWEVSVACDHAQKAKDPATDELRVQATFIPLGEHLRVAAQYGYMSTPLHTGTLQLQTNF